MPGQAIQTVTLGPRAESPEQAAEWLPLDARVKPEHDGVGGWRARAGRLGVRRLVPALGGEGEDLVAGGGDADGMLELGRELHVAGDGGPAVLQDLHLRAAGVDHRLDGEERSEEHTSELQSLMRNSYAVFFLKKKKKTHN